MGNYFGFDVGNKITTIWTLFQPKVWKSVSNHLQVNRGKTFFCMLSEKIRHINTVQETITFARIMWTKTMTLDIGYITNISSSLKRWKTFSTWKIKSLTETVIQAILSSCFTFPFLWDLMEGRVGSDVPLVLSLHKKDDHRLHVGRDSAANMQLPTWHPDTGTVNKTLKECCHSIKVLLNLGFLLNSREYSQGAGKHAKTEVIAYQFI